MSPPAVAAGQLPAVLYVDRIVIEADPAAPPGSVVPGGRGGLCENGYAVDIAHSKYVTIRGLTIVGAGGRGVGLRGGSAGNTGIHLERNRIGRGGTSECNGGIDVGRGNPRTAIANTTHSDDWSRSRVSRARRRTPTTRRAT